MSATQIGIAGLVSGVVPVDCPECRSAGSVYGGVCEVCYAEFGEQDPAAEPLRFVDVLDELGRAADLAGGVAPDFAAACRRLERLLLALRSQFLRDVVLPPTIHEDSTPPSPKSSQPALD